MKRLPLIICILVTALSTVFVVAPPAAAWSDGDAMCAGAQAAADGDATTFQGYAIVRAPGQGGSGAQVVLGTPGNDTVSGGSGNDLLCGFGGEDILIGGSSNDILVGGAGVDQLFGDTGGDTLYGDPSDFVLFGGSGRNQVIVTEPTPAVLTYALTLVEGFKQCTLSASLTGGPADTVVQFSFDLANDPNAGAGTFALTDASGAASADFGPFAAQMGATVTSASVIDTGTGEVIATAPAGQLCGE